MESPGQYWIEWKWPRPFRQAATSLPVQGFSLQLGFEVAAAIVCGTVHAVVRRQREDPVEPARASDPFGSTLG